MISVEKARTKLLRSIKGLYLPRSIWPSREHETQGRIDALIAAARAEGAEEYKAKVVGTLNVAAAEWRAQEYWGIVGALDDVKRSIDAISISMQATP